MHMHCYAVKISKMDAYNDSTIVHARAVLAALRREWREGSRHMSERLTRPPVKELRLRRELEKEERPVPRAAAAAAAGLVAAAVLPPSSSSRISPTAFFSSRVRARPTYSPRWRQLRTWRYPHFPVSAAIALTNGRIIDDGRTSLTDEEELCVPCGDADSLDMSKVASMGKASLRLLVKAIAADTGKCGYLHVRNCLQRGEYVGRALTRDEKNAVGEILEELEGGSTAAATKPAAAAAAARGTGRSSFSNSRLNRSSFTGGRVSLSDMCRDPSLHSRLSAANTARA